MNISMLVLIYHLLANWDFFKNYIYGFNMADTATWYFEPRSKMVNHLESTI